MTNMSAPTNYPTDPRLTSSLSPRNPPAGALSLGQHREHAQGPNQSGFDYLRNPLQETILLSDMSAFPSYPAGPRLGGNTIPNNPPPATYPPVQPQQLFTGNGLVGSPDTTAATYTYTRDGNYGSILSRPYPYPSPEFSTNSSSDPSQIYAESSRQFHSFPPASNSDEYSSQRRACTLPAGPSSPPVPGMDARGQVHHFNRHAGARYRSN